LIDTGFEDSIGLDTRFRVYREIEQAPGLHFREIQRRTGLATGTLQYHLGYLEKKRLVFSERKGKFLQYYSIRSREEKPEKEALSILRQQSERHIIIVLLMHGRATNVLISSATGLFPSTVSWHLSKLMEKNAVTQRKVGRKVFYYLKDPEKMINVLSKHRTSFLDEVVDNFVSIWDNLNK
jgi:predicted transcriptional regulator